ncbi:hypothetical protein RclHR1_03580012 [Rhizophagus clarus]|uniref:Autophagy-related protein 11 n=1 Tax=Rhizophagus clarus TaxID=94130 RepID=A0A2Z6RB18_9GLOM|nr:hypothetical protein RclHR1_03580012 [Rhizophagus clarus]GES79086.1 ubiquitin domain containing protein [Rhizophagus clarus]
MKIYRAETGKRIQVRKSFESLGELKAELEQVGGVPVSSQILMTSFGLQLKTEMINDANKAVGKDEYIIFLFDRDLLDVNNANDQTSLIEDPSLEPPIIAPAASNILTRRSTRNNINLSEECGIYVNLFQTHHSQGQSFIKTADKHIGTCKLLYQEQKIQLMALNVAITNLDSHCRSIIEAHEDIYAFAEKEITKQAKLIQSLSTDIETLRHITIHPGLLKDARNLMNDRDSYTLADLIAEEKLIILAKEGKQAYDQISKRVQELTTMVRSVQSGSDTLKKKKFDFSFPKIEAGLNNIREYYSKLTQFAQKLERDVTRVQSKVSEILESNVNSSTTTIKSIEAFEHLSNIHSQEYLPEMQKYDQYIRDQVKFLAQCKNGMTSTLISSLQQISRLESSIASIPDLLRRLDSDIQSKSQEFKNLNHVHQMPIAYAKTIVEIVRRKEYANLILTKAQQMAEIMAHFRNTEQKRRDSYRTDVKKYVPINIPALDDNPPMCDISTANIKEDKLPSFTAEDIHSFLNYIEEIRPAVLSQASFHGSPTFNASPSKIRIQPPQNDPLASLQAVLLKLVNQIEGMNYEFDRIVEKTFLSEKSDNGRNSSTISRPISLIEGRTLTPQLPMSSQLGRRSKRTSRQSFSEDSAPQIDVNMDLYFEKTKQLDKAEEKIKAYEARIKNLETILHKNYQAAKNSPAKSETSVTEEEFSDLRSRYQSLESSYTVEISEKKKQENKINELEMRYKNLESSYNAIVNEKETLLKRINELESRHQNSEASHSGAIKEIEERALTLESSYALVLKENEDLHAKFNELQTLYDSSKMRCNELEAKIAESEAKINELEAKIDELEAKIAELEKVSLDLRSNEQDNFYSEQVEGIIKDLKQKYQDSKSENHKLHDEYEKKIRDLEAIQRESDRQCVKLQEENEWIIKEKEVLNAAKSNLELKFNDILAEKNKLETSFEEYKQKFEEKESLYNQRQSELNKRIEELEAEQLGQEQIEIVKEQWKEKVEELQKEKDETNKAYELNKQNLLHEIESWKANLERMNSAREEYEKQLDKTRERVKLAEQESAENRKALEQAEKLVRNITEAIVEYMPIVTAYEESKSTGQAKLETNLNPINMIQKVGSVTKSMAQELHDAKQLTENSKATNIKLEKSLDETQQKLKERTEFSRVLSKYLWEYYINIRTLMNAMGLALPLNDENKLISLISIEEEKGNSKSTESRLSDSYYAEDLGKFFSNDSLIEPIEWPKDKYVTLLTLSTKVNLSKVCDMIRRTPSDAENLAKKYQEESKTNKEKYHKYRKSYHESKEKIAFRNFKNGDLALFLPTRNSTAKPWAAFNINCPHYFLNANDSIIRHKDWIVARIVNISEHVVDIKSPKTNPYELPDGVKYYSLSVEVYQNNLTSSHHSRKRSDSDRSSRMSASLNLSSTSSDINLNMSSSTADVSTRSRIQSMPPRAYSMSSTHRTSPPGTPSKIGQFGQFFNLFSSSETVSEPKENTRSNSDSS